MPNYTTMFNQLAQNTNQMALGNPVGQGSRARKVLDEFKLDATPFTASIFARLGRRAQDRQQGNQVGQYGLSRDILGREQQILDFLQGPQPSPQPPQPPDGGGGGGGTDGGGGGGDGGETDGGEEGNLQDWLDRILSGDFPTNFPDQPNLRDILPGDLLRKGFEKYADFFSKYRGEQETLARDLFQTRQQDIERRLGELGQQEGFAERGFRQSQEQARTGATQSLLQLFQKSQALQAESGLAGSGAIQRRMRRGREQVETQLEQGTEQRQLSLAQQLQQIASREGSLGTRSEELENQFAQRIYGFREGYAEDVRGRLIDILQSGGELFAPEEIPDTLQNAIDAASTWTRNHLLARVGTDVLEQYATFDNPLLAQEKGSTWTDPWGNTWEYYAGGFGAGGYWTPSDGGNGNGNGNGDVWGTILEDYDLTPEQYETYSANEWKQWYKNWYAALAPDYHMNLLEQSDAETWNAKEWQDWLLEFTGFGGNPFS